MLLRPSFFCLDWNGNGACVYVTVFKVKGRHVGLSSSSIHRMTGLGGKFA